MKKTMVVFVMVMLVMCVSTAEAASGSSAWFPVDTTDGTLKVSDVRSKYFDGEYGGVGRKATFLNGVSCNIEMTILMDDYSKVDHWLVNGQEVATRTFTRDVGSLPVGGRLEVIAVGKDDGVRSKSFRVNFDVAKHLDEEHMGLWTARPSNSGGIDEIRYTIVGAGSVSFPLALEKKITKPAMLRWVPGDNWSICPKVELTPEVRSSGNGCCKLATIKGTSKNKFGEVMDKDVAFTLSGGPLTLSWNAMKQKWVCESASFGLEAKGSIRRSYPYFTPTIPPIPVGYVKWKGEIALSGSVKVSGIDSALSGNGWGGLESAFTFRSDSFPKFSAGGGLGVDGCACIEGLISGMSVFNVTYSKGAWSDFRWGLKASGELSYKLFVLEGKLIELTSDTYWLINNTSPKSMRLMASTPTADIEWRLQSRDYLKKTTPRMRLMAAAPTAGVVESGGYPNPVPAIASGTDGDALVYLRDNAERTSANRTELVLRMGTSNEWNAAEVVWDDGTADFMASLVAMPDGSIAVAWMNASRTFSDSVTLDEFCGAEEIAVGIRNPATGNWTCRNLTADGAFDFAPTVRAAANGKVLVAWLRNASGKMVSSAEEPTDILAAIYANGAWGAPAPVLNGVGIVNGFDVAFDGESAVLVFSKDADGDPSTLGDAEIYAVRLDGSSWGSPIRLTASGDADGRPFVRGGGDEGFAVLWTAEGALMETRELALSNAVIVATMEGRTLGGELTMIRGANGRDALLWNGDSEAGDAADAPTAMMYDPVCGTWGSPVKLLDDGRKERRFSGAVGTDGGIRIGYESLSVATNAEGEVTFGDVELRTRFIPAICDLAVVEDGFSFSTNEFVNGETIALTVRAANLGFRTATNATVTVYEGAGEDKTELASVITNFPGGGVVVVNVPWTVDTTQTNLQFTVEVAAGDNAENEAAKTNNLYVWFAGMYDVAFGGVSVRNESATRRLLTANVVNKGLGSLPAGARVVFRRGGVNGEIIAEDVIGKLLPGEDGVYVAGVAWDIEGVEFASMWETVCVQLYPEGIVGSMLDAADTAFVQVKTTKEYTASMIVCEDIFDGVGTVSMDGTGNTVVTLTNDVSGTVEIPDNVGDITIDLNGHSITGTDGGAGIRIVAGEDEGVVTTLAIGDKSEGEKGQIAGDGDSSGIEVAEDAAPNVRIDVEGGVTVLNGDGTEQEFKTKLVGTGTVTVPKTWKTGQKVTWKAKADKGSVFARWEGPLVDTLGLSRNELRNPSLAFAVPDGFETNQITAVFIPFDDDGLSELALTQTEFELKAAVDGVWVTDDSESYVTASVSGLPTGLKFDAKTFRITGAPTKGGVYWVQVKAKNASGYQWAENVKVTVTGGGAEAKEPKLTRTAYYPLTVITTNAVGGTVSGTGVYAEGKKAAIKATAAKGYVFAGWYEDSRLTTPATFEKDDFRTASQNVVVPGMRYVFARFVTEGEDKAGVTLAVDGVGMEAAGAGRPPYQTNVMCGVYMEWPVAVEALSATTVKVAGLPAGLKFTDKPVTTKVGSGKSAVVVTNVPANTIYGTPTAASKVDTKKGVVPSDVKVTVTTAGKTTATFVLRITVDPLPDWAAGTFGGYVRRDEVIAPYQDAYGSATMTVAANGKVSGKIALDGTNWTFKADSYSAVRRDGGIAPYQDAVETNFVINAEATAGKAKKEMEIRVRRDEVIAPYLINGKAVGETADGEWSLALWRGMWKDKATAAAAKSEIAKWEGVYTLSLAPGDGYGSGYLSLTVGKDGTVKATGKLADDMGVSATSPLMYDPEEGWFAYFYVAPSAYKGGCFAVAVRFNDERRDEVIAPYQATVVLANAMGIAQWTSRNPEATGEYGAGFRREVAFTGAYYDKLDTLRKYYESLRVSLDGGAPSLAYTYKETLVSDGGKKATFSSVKTAEAVNTLDQSGMTVSVDEKGALVVTKATKPVQDKDTKEWSYHGANDGALTLSFTQATGIFKGSYTFWYDYVSAYDETKTKDNETRAHTSKKVNFEGIWVQGAESLCGFYPWDASGSYEDPKTGRPKAYKFKESRPVTLLAQ